MQEFQILDERRYPLKVKNVTEQYGYPYWRWEHRVTLGQNFRTFMVYIDTFENKLYIEEIAYGNLVEVKEDSLRADLFEFAQAHGFVEFLVPLPRGVL